MKSVIVITHIPADFIFFCWNTFSYTTMTFLLKVLRRLKIILSKIKSSELIIGPGRCLATLIQCIAAMLHTQLEKHKLEGSVFSGRQMMSMTMMISYGSQIAVGDWCYIY